MDAAAGHRQADRLLDVDDGALGHDVRIDRERAHRRDAATHGVAHPDAVTSGMVQGRLQQPLGRFQRRVRGVFHLIDDVPDRIGGCGVGVQGEEGHRQCGEASEVASQGGFPRLWRVSSGRVLARPSAGGKPGLGGSVPTQIYTANS